MDSGSFDAGPPDARDCRTLDGGVLRDGEPCSVGVCNLAGSCAYGFGYATSNFAAGSIQKVAGGRSE